MTEEQQDIALEEEDKEEGSNNTDPNILSFKDDREYQAYLANLASLDNLDANKR